MKLLSGLKAREHILKNLKKELVCLKRKNIIPTLAVIHNNDEYASKLYIANKQKLCCQLGINLKIFKLPNTTTNKQMISLISRLNKDRKINGLFVQLPTSKLIDNDAVINAICPNKDVDCFHNLNFGKIWTSKNVTNLIKPCTPAGIIELLKFYKISLSGKSVAIINRSNIVGKPLAALFLHENATVTICHKYTKNLKMICKNSDIVVTAISKPNFFDKSYFKKGAIIIDVSINRNKNKKLCGDINVKSLKNFNCKLTPVPGGVGPMTSAMLIKNLVILTKRQYGGK